MRVLVDGGGSATGFVGSDGGIDGTLAFSSGEQEPDRLTAVATIAGGKGIRVTHQN